MSLYRQLLAPLLLLVAVAVALRVVWELVAPVLLPLGVVALVATLAVVAYRRR